MAKQCGTYCITGTIDNLCFYRMEGKYYARRKSSLTGKRVRKDAAFAQTMFYANLLGKASKIASAFYKTIPKEGKTKGLYRHLTGMVIQLLKDGKNEQVIIACLEQCLQPKPTVNIKQTASAAVTDRHINHFPDALLEVIFATPACYRKNDNRRDVTAKHLKNYGFV